MPNYDLCSAVFELSSERRLSNERMGQAVQKIFLAMLGQMTQLTGDNRYAELATAIHPPKGSPQLRVPLPYTVNDWVQPNSPHLWIRITGLEARLCDALAAMVEKLPGHNVDIPPRPHTDEKAWTVHVQAGMLSGQAWTGQISYMNFVEENWKPPLAGRLRLEFTKPVVIESWGIYRPFPEPTTVFRLLYERIQKVEGIRLPFTPETDQLEAFVFYLIGIADYQIQCEEVELERKVIGFSGWTVYKIFSENKSLVNAATYRRDQHGEVGLITVVDNLMRNYDTYVRLVNLLAAFAFYSGLGGYTAKGMGMVRKVERSGR